MIRQFCNWLPHSGNCAEAFSLCAHVKKEGKGDAGLKGMKKAEVRK